MKIYIISTLFTFLSFTLAGQNVVVKSFKDTLNLDYSLSSNQLTKGTSADGNQALNQKNRLGIKEVSIEKGDLLIDFDLYNFRKREKDMKMQMELAIEDPITGQKTFAAPQIIIGDKEINFNNKIQSKQLVWEDWVETIKPSGSSLSLSLTGNLIDTKGVINCNKPPLEWENKQRNPYLFAAGLGIGLFVASFPLKSSAEKLEKQYYDDTFNRNFNEASANYRKANDKNRSANLIRNTGIGIMVASAVSATTHLLIYKKNKKHYDYYCQPKITIAPNFQWQGLVSDNTGITLNYSF